MRRATLLVTVLIIILSLAGCMVRTRPLTFEEISARVDHDRAGMFVDQEPVRGPISLHEAMARAIKYNLDHRLKRMEAVLADADLKVARFEQLPELAASAGYRHRNNYSGSSSEALSGPGAGTESLVASTSQERDLLNSDVTLVWNVLDFGVSYVRARQQADQRLIAAERRRKVIQNIFQDVRSAYWRAVSAQLLLGELIALRQEAQSALERSQQIAAQRLGTPREALEYQRGLLENIRLLWELIQRLTPAKTELASLMNLSPGTDYTLVVPDWQPSRVTLAEMPVDRLEALALAQRPELREEDLKARIGVLETRKTLLQMLPGLDLRFGHNTDSNDYLYNNEWWQAGAQVSMNIFNLLTGPAAYQAAKVREQLDDARRRSVSMAVLTQVHLSRQHYQLTQEDFEIARRLDDVNQRLAEQLAAARQAGRVDDLTVIRNATQAMVARLRHHLVYAAMENAAARIYHSVGVDIVPESVESTALADLAQVIRAGYVRYETPAPVTEPTPAAAPAPEPETPSQTAGAPVENLSPPSETVDTGPLPAADPVPAAAGAATDATPARTNAERVNVRQDPFRRAPRLGQILAAGTPVQVHDRRGSWLSVTTAEVSGWVYGAYVDPPGPPPTGEDAAVSGYRVNLRSAPDPGASILGAVDNRGTRVKILERQSGWIRIRVGALTGWMAERYVEPVDGPRP